MHLPNIYMLSAIPALMYCSDLGLHHSLIDRATQLKMFDTIPMLICHLIYIQDTVKYGTIEQYMLHLDLNPTGRPYLNRVDPIQNRLTGT